MTTPESEYSQKFLTRIKQAMGVSYHKYGPVKEAYPHKVSAVSSLRHRLQMYEKTGNQDFLVDVAAFAMIEFMLPAHDNPHDTPTDGGEGRKWHAGGRANENTNEGARR